MKHLYYVLLVLLLTYISSIDACTRHAPIRPNHAHRAAGRPTYTQYHHAQHPPQPRLAHPLPRHSSWTLGPPMSIRTQAATLILSMEDLGETLPPRASNPTPIDTITLTPPATPTVATPTPPMEALGTLPSVSTQTSAGTPTPSTPRATPPATPTLPIEDVGTLPSAASAGTPNPSLVAVVEHTALSPSALTRPIASAELPASSTLLPSPTVSDDNDTSAMMISQMLDRYAQQATKTLGALKDPDETDWVQLEETPAAKTSPTHTVPATTDQSLVQRFFALLGL